MNEEAASGLGARIISKINEIISTIKSERKADTAWRIDIESRLIVAEEALRALQAQNHGLKSTRGKALAAQKRAETKLEEARRLLN